jgi:DNA-binding XRE family transcriptional regulator
MKKKLRNRIAIILEEQHITPYRLAKNLDIPAQTAYNWCRNKSNPSQQYIVPLMKMLGVQLEDILEVEYE